MFLGLDLHLPAGPTPHCFWDSGKGGHRSSELKGKRSLSRGRDLLLLGFMHEAVSTP